MREMDFVDEYYADKDLSLLKKLTLVIPTYNRNYYLSRCLWYHAHFPFGEIIVADSSPEEKKVVNRETVQKIHEMFGANIRYLEYEPETEKYGGDIYRKWGDAVQHVGTEYAVIVADKQYLDPEGGKICVDYLEKNQEYFAADGNYYMLWTNNEVSPAKESDLQIVHWRAYETSEICDDPFKRHRHACVLQPPFQNSAIFAVHRTKYMKNLYSQITLSDENDIRYSELLLAFGGYLMGKFAHIPTTAYQIRDEIIYSQEKITSTSIKTGESSSSRYPQISEYDTPTQNHFKAQYLNSLKIILVTNVLIGKTDIETYLQKHKEDVISVYGGVQERVIDNKSNKYIIKIHKNNRKLILRICYAIPRRLRKMLYQLGMRHFGIAPPIYNTREVLTKAEYELLTYSAPVKEIERLVLDTQKLHDNDETIFGIINNKNK